MRAWLQDKKKSVVETREALLDVCLVFVEILWHHGDKALKYRIKQD